MRVFIDANLVLDAHELAQAEQLSWFDALIVEAAIRGGLTVCNPFLPASD